MPDYSFISQSQVPNAMNTLGSMLDLAGKTQNLQLNRLNLQQKTETLPADIARAQAESERAKAEAAVSTGTQQPRIAQAGTEAAAAQFKLTGDQSAKAMQIASGLMQDPRIANSDPTGTIDAANEAYGQMVATGVPKQTADFWASQVKAKAHEPGGALQLLQNVTRAAAGPQTQAGVINAPVSMVQTPAGAIAPVQLQPGASGAVQPVPISSLQGSGVIPPGIPPSGLQGQLTTDVLGQPIIPVKDQKGNTTFQAPPGSNYKPVMQFPQGESPQTLPEVQAIRTTANTAGAAAPSQHFNNRMILNLAPEAFTGTGGGKLAAVLGTVGLQTTNNVSSDTAQLKHFIALQIEQNASAQGANTDAARSLAAQAVLPTDSPERAIKSITKVNDAYVTGNELYNSGMEAAINNQGNQSGIFAARQFRNAWAQNFDPRITLLENAQKSGDTETVDRILGPKGSPQRKAAQAALLPKAQALQALSLGRM